ncbi:hypothetical protein [Streptomyces sp. NPDC059122]|uniref:hypothetical protein n=1 Tax=Streptomyces sp. NPDC059122 TaxID=3346732 RepID=UPI0036853296
MQVEKITAREVIHRTVQKKATEMDREKVAEETKNARVREHQAQRRMGEPGHLKALRHAERKHTDGRRIGYLTTEEHMETHTPQTDPEATKGQHQRPRSISTQETQEAGQ